MKKIVCYTDGACSCNPGPGGFGIVFIKNDKISSLFYGGNDYTTNNRMELLGVIEAINLAKNNKYDSIEIFSDSAYVVNAVTNKWFINWERNGWVTSQNKPVKNKDLWLKLMKAMEEIEIKFSKVKGHAGEEFNEIADKLAVKATNDISEEKISVGRVYDVSSSKDR